MKRVMWLLPLLMVVVMLMSGCATEMFDNIKSKSFNVSTSGMGGSFTTSIDPATGAVSPKVDFGSLSASVMSHKPGDGSMIHVSRDKSFWGAEMGSEVYKVNCRSGIKKLVISYIPQGQSTFTLSEYDIATIAVETLQKFNTQLAANGPTVNAKIASNFATVKANQLTDPKLKARIQALVKMPQAELMTLVPTDDPVDNQMIGDELLRRAVANLK